MENFEKVETKIWILSCLNQYSYAENDHRITLIGEADEAKGKFKEVVREYIKDEVEMAKEVFDNRGLNTLEDIINYIAGNNGVDKDGNEVEYRYGIDTNDKTFYAFTISRSQETIDGVKLEEVRIILEQIIIGKKSDMSCVILDNVEKVKEVLENM